MIEPLAARIAPAVVISTTNPKIATYTDADGDAITLQLSLGDWNGAVFTTTPLDSGELSRGERERRRGWDVRDRR